MREINIVPVDFPIAVTALRDHRVPATYASNAFVVACGLGRGLGRGLSKTFSALFISAQVGHFVLMKLASLLR